MLHLSTASLLHPIPPIIDLLGGYTSQMDPVSAFMRLSGETDIKKKTDYFIASYLPCGQCDRRG